MGSPERLALARELHDGIAQDLVALGYSLDLLLSNESLDIPARAAIRQTRLQIDQMAERVRAEILQLRIGKQLSLSELLKAIGAKYSDSYEVTVEVQEVYVEEEILPEITAVVAELLRNIAAHAGGTRILIQLYPLNNRIFLEICDDGIGGAKMKDGRWGIPGVVERVRAIGGEMVIEDRKDGEGTRITILI